MFMVIVIRTHPLSPGCIQSSCWQHWFSCATGFQ